MAKVFPVFRVTLVSGDDTGKYDLSFQLTAPGSTGLQ